MKLRFTIFESCIEKGVYNLAINGADAMTSFTYVESGNQSFAGRKRYAILKRKYTSTDATVMSFHGGAALEFMKAWRAFQEKQKRDSEQNEKVA